MEGSDSQLILGRRQAALSAWPSMIYAKLHFDSASGEESYLPLSGRRYVMAGRSCPDHGPDRARLL